MIHMTSTTSPKSSRYNHRDRLGRFVRRVNLQELDLIVTEGGAPFVNDDADETHAHADCGNLKGRTFTTATKATGWLCSACIHIDPAGWIANANSAEISGTKVCDKCEAELGMRKFPTVLDSGWRFRGQTCRKCEAKGRLAARLEAAMVAA
jgi:ribosomal protein L40E